MKPLLRWAGSKRQLVPLITSALPTKFGKYLEPFAGSAAVFFDLGPKRAVLGDLNTELINFYEEVCVNAKEVFTIAHGLDQGRETYYSIRRTFGTEDKTTRAGHFLYLNRLAFNGIYRTNMTGKFNVPYGALRAGAFPEWRHIEMAQSLLESSKLVNGDFEETLTYAEAGDFCYIDPPYYSDQSRVFSEYDRKPFEILDLHRLRFIIERLDEKGVQFMVSYQFGPEAEVLSKGYRVIETRVRRSVAGSAAKRSPATEILVMNY